MTAKRILWSYARLHRPLFLTPDREHIACGSRLQANYLAGYLSLLPPHPFFHPARPPLPLYVHQGTLSRPPAPVTLPQQ